MAGLSNHYLNELSRYCLTNFKKVIPCDYIQRYKLKTNDQFIINLSDSSTNGSHFVALSIKEKHCIYFDSFGFECKNSYITKKLKKCKKQIIYSKTQVQGITSLFCGFYCLAYLISDEKGTSLNNFLNNFEYNNLEKNDKICMDYIISHLTLNNRNIE